MDTKRISYHNDDERLYMQIEKMIHRGTIRILEKQDDSIFLQELVSTSYILWTQDLELAKKWIIKHEKEGYRLMLMFNREIREWIKERYSFSEGLICYQSVYEGDSIDLSHSPLYFKQATLDDLDIIMSHYDHISREEMSIVILSGHVILGYEGNTLIGFIGEHLEGSMGMLYIFEEHRKKGYGYLLEAYMINHTIEEGYIPYCHVETFNTPSLRLQSKLGLITTQKLLYWLF